MAQAFVAWIQFEIPEHASVDFSAAQEETSAALDVLSGAASMAVAAVESSAASDGTDGVLATMGKASRSRIVNAAGIGGASRASVVNAGGI